MMREERNVLSVVERIDIIIPWAVRSRCDVSCRCVHRDRVVEMAGMHKGVRGHVHLCAAA
jgi:hypothetical protein